MAIQGLRSSGGFSDWPGVCCFDRLLRSRELALDILKVGLVPAFGHLAINKSAASMDVEPNLPPRRGGHTQNFAPQVGCADIEICFYRPLDWRHL